MTTRLSPGAEERLRDVQAITDSALSHLDAEDLLVELISRLRAVLQADTAAVLLLDHASGQLIATAASGLEEEVRQGVRIPVGKGFAGRVAAERRTVMIDHVDHTTVLNPILIEKGLRALIGVPLIADGIVIGVLHVGSLTSRTFSAEDAGLLQIAADRAAAALRLVMSRSDREAALALQRSLIPSALPFVAGVEMAARYVPGHGAVGGDWYDVFTLPSGELCVGIGDVAGAGLKAAVIMGRMRSALRAYAMETTDPSEVLGRLDRKIQHFEPGAVATVLYGVFGPDLDHLSLSSAGHFPPAVAEPGQPGRLADIGVDLLIGVDSGVSRHVTSVCTPPGTLLYFYTDGLVERRGESLDDGLARLCGAVAAGPPDAVCASVMGTMVGSETARDDIATLALRRTPAGT
jgi:sigma-B regulation protein RsbU (phosphoserine phosphatase)